MQRMKLIATPLLIRLTRQSYDAELPQRPLFIVDRLRAPLSIHHWIPKRATVRRPNLSTVINFLIAIIVTLRTRCQRAGNRAEAHALMFSMTINATNGSCFMWFDHRRRERLRTMTRSTSLLHVA